MSRTLPPHPNLDHLKKQAKALLRELKQRSPGLKLADAQHALAREYGFASWPKLKAYVEALPRPPAPAGPDPAQPKPSPFAGRWTANLSKSTRHPGNLFQSAILQVTVVGDAVTFLDVIVDEAGREVRGSNTLLADGVERPSEHGNGYALTARWRGPRRLETAATRGGQAAGGGTYEVSDDGQTLTISSDQQRIVLDRS